MRIVHISDWHGDWRWVPKADLYLVTGDMLRNYPRRTNVWIDSGLLRFKRLIVPELEEKMQLQWMTRRRMNLRKFLGSQDAPVVVVRGNHDFIDLGPWFGGEVFEVTEDSTRAVEFFGLKFGGCRGINRIAGEWSDELDEATFDDRARKLPLDLDVLVTHAPPSGILDGGVKHGGYGSAALGSYLSRLAYAGGRLKLHAFGHSHLSGGGKKKVDEILFSNAATQVNVLDI